MLKRTPLYDKHLALSAKMVSFAGWEMPVSYPAGIIAEHNAVRTSAGLFDIGHMGLIKVEGEDALPLIQRLTTNDASKLELNTCQYAVICNEGGGTRDDILVYRLPMMYLLVVNAVNAEKILGWFKRQAAAFQSVQVGCYENYGMLSVQGPQAAQMVGQALSLDLSMLKRNHTLWWRDIIVSRTGYTGEDGVELMVARSEVAAIWNRLLAAGAAPCGLGARDTLRLEAGLPLYGHEYDEQTTPLEAGYAWAVKFDKGEFIGRAALLRENERGLKKKLVGLELGGRAIARAGAKIVANNQQLAGAVTSGTFSPTLKRSIALAYLEGEGIGLGKDVDVIVRNTAFPARIVAKTFYKR